MKRTYETTKQYKIADSRCGRGIVRRTRSRPCFHSRHHQESEGKPCCHQLSFRSKEDLIAAVFERRVVPVNEARLAALDRVEKSAGRRIPKLEAVLEAFIRPALQSSLKASKGGTAFSKLFGRCLSEPSPEVVVLLKRQFEPLVQRMDSALKKALPHLSRSEIFWRMKFTYGALHHWLLTKDKFRPDWVEDVDVETQTQKLISFAAAGFRAA